MTMSLETLIEELRAELVAFIDWDEWQQIKAEMTIVEVKLTEEKAAFDALTSSEPTD
ncbi:hypothetical protein EDF70_11265 [Neorhizobium sp. JUb45]|nr:hypothetical protein EDF70_11265 [Neorhizobium sp. JUb45]